MVGRKKRNCRMEIREVIITSFAKQILFYYLDYIGRESSESIADKFKYDFLDLVERLDINYFAFPECKFLPTKNKIYRNIIWNKYLIVYKIVKDEILVLGLFHTSQNPDKLKSFRKIRK